MSTNQQQMIPKPDGGNKVKTFYWLLFFTFVLYIFSQTTPFFFNWVKAGVIENMYSEGAAGMIERADKGNNVRRFWMVVLAGGFFLSLIRAKSRFQIHNPLGLSIIVYLGLVLLSISVSDEPLYTIRRVAVLYLMWIAAICAAAQLSFLQFTRMAAFVTGIIILLGFGNELRYDHFDMFNGNWRFSGIFHCVSMGIHCGLFVISTLFLVSVEKRPFYRKLLWGMVIIGAFFLFLTRTRTAAVATLLAAGFYWSFLLSPLKKILLVLGAIICLSVMYVGMGSRLAQYGEDATTLGRGKGGTESVSSLTGRIPLWKFSLESLPEKPLLGFGYSSFLTPRTVDKFAAVVGWRPNSLHSAYVNELMGTGILGATAFVAMLALAMTRALTLARRTRLYYYIFSVVVWAATLFLTEAGVANGMTFVIFYVYACMAKLAFCPVTKEDWE